MQRRIPPLAVISLLVSASALVVLGGCSDDEALRLSQAEVAKGNEAIAALNEEIAQRDLLLAEANDEIALGNETIAALNAKVAQSSEDILLANETIEEFVGSNAEWEQEYASLTLAHDALAQDKAELETALSARQDQLDETLEELAATLESLEKSESDLAVLRGAEGLVQALEKRAAELEAEIRELMEKRKPLILAPGDTFWASHKCTGSMEPAYGCLDELLHLRDFEVGDITVGTIIGYSPGCNDPIGATHRVMDVKVVDGQPHYWPQGDSNRSPDGCWVPHSDVIYYLIDIRRNVYPENAELRDAVNTTKASYYTAIDAAKEAWRAHDEFVDPYCGSQRPCTLPSGSVYERGLALFRAAQAASDEVQAKRVIYRCWHDAARDSERPGHIPRRC